MSLRQKMVPFPRTCSASDSVAEVAQLMRDFDVASLPVTDATSRVVGIVTHRDVRKATETSLTHRIVSDVMRPVTRTPAAASAVQAQIA